MELLDTTLREGEQCYGVFFPVEAKKKLACLLDAIGVDFIEVGHPAAAPSIERAIAEIVGLGLQASLIAHARLDPGEILQVKTLGVAWVGLFASINEAGLRRYGLTRNALYARITRAVRHAKDMGLKVRFTCEDASRTNRSELSGFYQALGDLNVDRLSYADTVGVDSPDSIARLPVELGGLALFKELHFHFHDDLGRAHDNAKTAAMLGARCLDVSVLGIGERSGIPSLRAELSRTKIRRKAIQDAGPLLDSAELLASKCVDYERYARRRFAHKSGIHIHGVLQDPAHYEAAAAAVTDETRTFVLSKLVGRAGLRTMLSWSRIPADGPVLEHLLARVKADEFLELADRSQIVQYLEEQCRTL